MLLSRAYATYTGNFQFLSNINGTLAWRLCWYSTTPSLGGLNTNVKGKTELRYSAVMYELFSR